MIAATDTDLSTLAARLVEVFEIEEFSAEDAKDLAAEGELSRLVAANLICEQRPKDRMMIADHRGPKVEWVD